jgi:small GTP-binding protein
MIKDFFVFDEKSLKVLYHSGFSRSPIPEDSISQFIGEITKKEGVLEQRKIIHYPNQNFEMLLTKFQDRIYVLCYFDENSRQKMKKKLNKLIDRLNRINSWQNKEEITPDLKKNLNDIAEKTLLDQIKIALVGFGGCGKTTIYQKIKGYDIPLDYLPTMFVQYKKLNEEFPEIDVLIWDFAGRERFTPLWPMLLRGCDIVLLVTDSTVENALQTKRVFLKIIEKSIPKAKILGIANKQDLPKAMSPEMVKKVLGIDNVIPLSAISLDAQNFLHENIIGIVASILGGNPPEWRPETFVPEDLS